MTEFVPGLKLSELFYEETVRPVLQKHFPQLPYSAALIGHGSEVLGFDTERSTDHHWGPRVQIFLNADDNARYSSPVREVLSRELPVRFRGYSTNWGPPDGKGVQLLQAVESGPVNHRVETLTIRAFVENLLCFDPYGGIDVLNWLTFLQQELLCLTAGKVFYDGLGELENIRSKFSYYPHDVWLFLIASQWMKISQEETFPGRCAEVGDDIGSRIIAARLVRELMRLCFMLEKNYIPYSKWFGSAFLRLRCAGELAPVFLQVMSAGPWKEREAWLCRAYEAIGSMHNSMGITEYIEPRVQPFYGRPYLVPDAERFARATMSALKDTQLKAIGLNVGSVDQFDGSDATTNPHLTQRLRALYE